MKFMIATKIGMTQEFTDDGTVVPVTVLQAGPVTVTQVKTADTDGYCSVQVGFGSRKASRVSKPVLGHLKDAGPFQVLKEFRLSAEEAADYTTGQVIATDVFTAGQKVKATGTSKGSGFAGVVKRHGFAGSPATHGHKDQHRMPGSVGSQDPQRVFPGMRMGGRMGGGQSSVRNLLVVSADAATNQLKVRGAVPGSIGGLVFIETM